MLIRSVNCLDNLNIFELEYRAGIHQALIQQLSLLVELYIGKATFLNINFEIHQAPVCSFYRLVMDNFSGGLHSHSHACARAKTGSALCVTEFML